MADANVTTKGAAGSGGAGEVVGGVFNDAGADQDFRVEGDTDPSLLVTDAGNERVGVKTATPVTDLQVNGQALVEAGRGYSSTRTIPVTYGGTGGAAVFSVDPTMDNDQLAAFFGLTTSEISWETGADGADAPGGPAFKVTGATKNIGGHWGGAPMIPIEATTSSKADGAASATYYGEMWVKCNQASPTIYAGSTEYEHDLTLVPHHESGSAFFGNPGAYGYWINAGSGVGTVVGTSWRKISGYISGFDDTDQYKFESNSSLFSPLALVNWSGSPAPDAASITWISGWKVWKVSESGDRNFVGSNISSGATADNGIQFYSPTTARILQMTDAGVIAVNEDAAAATTGLWAEGGGKLVVRCSGPNTITTTLPLTTGTVQTGCALRLEASYAPHANVLDFGLNSNAPHQAWIQATNRASLGSNFLIALNPNGGNLSINRPDNGYPLHVGNSTANGNGAHCTAGGVWTDTSNRESKDNITPLSEADATAAIMALEPQTYNYKDTTETHVGFIAEDVPDLVASEDRKGLSSMDIVAALTKVVQRQEAQIKKLMGKDD